jgi:integrase
MAGMGRTRKKNKHLPARVYQRGRAYHFVDKAGRWHNLGRDYPAALRKLAALMDIASPANTVAQLISRYSIEELAGKADKTVRGRLQEFKPLAKAFGGVAAETIEPHHVWTYFTARGKTEQARHEVRALSALLTYARRIGARTKPNPCFGLRLPGSRPRRHYVTHERRLAVRALAPRMIQYAMDIAYWGGLDQGTIRTLERRHVTAVGLKFDRSKTANKEGGSAQEIEFTVELKAAIDGALSERPQLRRFVICNRRGQAYSRNGFQSQWQRVMKKAKAAGLETFHFHDLRAKNASDSASDQEAADRLGHSSTDITRKVYRILPKRSRALGTALPEKKP